MVVCNEWIYIRGSKHNHTAAAMANVDEEIKALQKERESGIVAAADAEGDAEEGEGGDDGDGQVALTGAGAYDRDIYGGGGDKFAG